MVTTVSQISHEGAFERHPQLRITIGSEVNVEFLPPPKALHYGYRYALRIYGKLEIVIGFPAVWNLDQFVSEIKAIFCLIDDYDEKFLFDSWEEDNHDYSDDYFDCN